MAGNLGPARHVTRCRRLSGDHGVGGDGDVVLLLMIIISSMVCCGLVARRRTVNMTRAAT